MSYSEFMSQLITSGFISIVTIIDPSGNIYWTNNPNWQVNGADVLRQWSSNPSSIYIAGTKFSTIMNNYPSFFVGKNIPQQAGIVIICQSPNGYYFLTWSPANAPHGALNIHTEVTRMAALFK
ncbi:MAG: hypothetical protein ACFFDI_16385 [Promethearchaeota archaeon]